MVGANIASIWQDAYRYRQAYLLTAIASFGGMLFGWDTGLIGGVLTMSSFQDSFNVHKNDPGYANLSGNIVSVLQAGCFFGAASSFFLSDGLGRKRTIILADIIFLVGSLIQTLCAFGSSDKLTQLYIGRVIGGFGVGLISAVVPTYIGENANKEIRGRCIGCMQLFNVTGICLSFFVNYGVSIHIPNSDPAQWRVPFALQMLPGALLLFGMLFMNESPRWLVEKNRVDEARQALAKVRSKTIHDANVAQELDEIVNDFNGHERLSFRQQMKATFSEKRSSYVFVMAVALMFWQQWTGTNSINYYAPQIFQSVGLAGNQSSLFATGIYGVVKITITALGLMLATEQVGRKWSLIVGGLGQAFAMFYIGINQAVHPVVAGAPLTGNSYFAIVCVYLFVVFYSFGWGPVRLMFGESDELHTDQVQIPFVLSAECSPNHVRSLIMAAALMTQWLMNFVIAKITPIMLANITFGTFLVFAVCCILMVVFAILFVPETAGVPLESIALLFQDNIVAGATKDTLLSKSRAKALKTSSSLDTDSGYGGKDVPTHFEHIGGKGAAV